MRLYPRREIALQLDIPPEVFLERLAAAVRETGQARPRRSRTFTGRVEGATFQLQTVRPWFVRAPFDDYAVKGRVRSRAGGCEVAATLLPRGMFIAMWVAAGLTILLLQPAMIYLAARALPSGVPSSDIGLLPVALPGFFSVVALGSLWTDLHYNALATRNTFIRIANPEAELPPLAPPPSWGP